jgi:RND family efflux transporter MFP subunit
MVIEQNPTSPTSVPASNQAEKPVTTGGKGSFRALLLIIAAAALLLGYAIFSGVSARAKATNTLERETISMSAPTVAVVHPQPVNGTEEVILPGNMQAFIDTPIWARASGYLKMWNADIGAHVTQGQLLAEIEAPEVDQQLHQARADLNTAEANLKLSQVTAERYVGLFKTDSVSKQDVDNAVQDQAAKTATAKSAEANVTRLEKLVGYEKVFAPFSGVITARNTDIGALVDAGANTPGKELFHLASTATLRVYVSVPEIYSRAAKPGVAAYLTLSEFPGKQFRGTIVRNAEAIDQNSRTLLVEVDVKNPTGELLPGSYVSVHLKLPSKVQAVVVPSNVLLFRSEGLSVGIVQNNRTRLVPVILGHDYGDQVEVISGLHPTDAVIVNPSDSLANGEAVQIAAPHSAAAED